MRARRHHTQFDIYDPDAPQVFVPGILGAGILVSIGLLVADAFNKVAGDRGRERRIDSTAHHLAENVTSVSTSVEPQQRARDDHYRVRSRAVYGVVAIAALAIGFYALVGMTYNFQNPVDDGYIEDIGWIWAASLVAMAGFLTVGALAAILFLRWPRVPPSIRPLLARTPLGGHLRRKDGGQ